MASNGRLIDESLTEKNLEGSDRDILEVFLRHLPGRTEENYEHLSAGRDSNRALQNTSL
jgi:hypothetical protein